MGWVANDMPSWQDHSFHRNIAWPFYFFLNAVASYFNICLIIAVLRLKERKTSTDVLTAGLASGMVVSTFGCGFQCFFNMVTQDWAFGSNACFFEAFFHISGMIIQCAHVGAIAYRTYVGVVKLSSFKIQWAATFTVAIWVVALVGTFVFGAYSNVYLVASGILCFYDWDSLVLLAWAWPLAITTASLMGYWYFKTFQIVSRVRHDAQHLLVDGSKRNAALVLRLSALVLLFVYGYSGLICQSLYEVIKGRAKSWGDVLAAAIVLTYWMSAPCAYAYLNHRLGLSSVLFATPIILRKGHEKDLSSAKKAAASSRSSLHSTALATIQTQLPRDEIDISVTARTPRGIQEREEQIEPHMHQKSLQPQQQQQFVQPRQQPPPLPPPQGGVLSKEEEPMLWSSPSPQLSGLGVESSLSTIEPLTLSISSREGALSHSPLLPA